MNYAKAYERRARRAIDRTAVDLKTFFADKIASGVSPEAAIEQLMHDFDTGGPMFGQFARQIGGAAAHATAAAERQGELAGLISEDDALQRMLDITSGDIGNALDIADPEFLDQTEELLGDRVNMMWVAALEETCERCLPLHGSSMRLSEWQAAGLHPDSIHAGWLSECHCILVPDDLYPRDDVVDPLVRERVKSSTGLKGSKRTQRSVAQVDAGKSQRAVERVKQTLGGRRTLRLMGQVNR